MNSEKAEKAKVSAQIKHVPKDAQVIMSILKELNIQEYEPRVVNQLLEFTFRKYRSCITAYFSINTKYVYCFGRVCDLHTG